jgi:hypothetical protein
MFDGAGVGVKPRLLHYYSKPFELEPREYQQMAMRHHKPLGFWVSVEGEDDWKDWCQGEDWNTEFLAVAHEVTLKPDAKILWIDSCEGIDAFTSKYGLPIIPGKTELGFYVGWREVAKDYQGIIIAPYQWERRHCNVSGWYYSWDCASGCIWDLSAIESFRCLAELCPTNGGPDTGEGRGG